jgi:hypothetical protein
MFGHYLISPLRRCVERFSSRFSDFSSFFSDFSDDCVLVLREFPVCCVVGVLSVLVLPLRIVLAEAGVPRTPVCLMGGRRLGFSFQSVSIRGLTAGAYTI